MKKLLLFLFVLALCVRAFIFVALTQKGDNCWIYPDSMQYYTTAQQLVAGRGLTTDDGQPQMYRLPGYPVFLAACIRMLGTDAHRVLWLQVLLASLVPLLIFFLALSLFPGSLLLAKLAALAAALHVGLSIYASMVATETLFLVFLLLFFILFFRKHYALAGACLGVASLIRPVGHYVVVLAVGMIFLEKVLRSYPSIRFSQSEKHSGRTGYFRAIFFFAGSWLLVVTPWLVRNFLLTGALFFHTLPGHHFLQYSAAYVLMERDNCSYADVRPVLLAQWEQRMHDQEQLLQRSLNDYERCQLAEAIAWSIIKQHPWYFIKTAAVQVAKTCCSLYTAQVLLSDSGVWPGYTERTSLWIKIKRFLLPAVNHKILIPLIYLEILMFGLLLLGLLLFCVGVVCRYRHSERSEESRQYERLDPSLPFRMTSLALLQVISFVLLFLVLTLAYGCARLRMPVEPFIIIFSSAGWLWLFDYAWHLSSRRRPGSRPNW